VTITHHLSVNSTALLGYEGSSVFLVSGRLYGADDDDATLVRADDQAEAIYKFRTGMLGLEPDEDGNFPDEEDGPSHFIVNVDYVGELI
jgi:hypothetical protein